MPSRSPRRPRRFQSCRRSPAAVAGVLTVVLVALARSSDAQVSCANPDNLCVGSPCVIAQAVEVQSPCVVDFTPRALVLNAPINVPSGGVLSFTAASVTGPGRIDGRHLDAGTGVGAAVTLITTGDMDLVGRIDVAGSATAGSITLDAGGSIVLRDRLDAKAGGNGATTPGGTVTVDADGMLTLDQRAFVDVRGANGSTDGGTAVLQGALGVVVAGKAAVQASGDTGGQIEIASSAGDVTLGRKIQARGELAGGSVTVSAQGTVRVEHQISVRGDAGGTIEVGSASADVQIAQKLDARGIRAAGGAVTVSAAGALDVLRDLDARGRTTGGVIDASADTMTIAKKLRANGSLGSGGSVSLMATAEVDLAAADVLASGTPDGGTVQITATDVTLATGSALDVQGKGGLGGTVDVMASGTATLVGNVDADGGSAGGLILVDAGTLTVELKADLNANGGGGEIRFQASDPGLMLLAGDFSARNGGGVIEGQAALGDLTASGRFRAAPGGCIGLSAGGTLSTPGSFDVPLSASCP